MKKFVKKRLVAIVIAGLLVFSVLGLVACKRDARFRVDIFLHSSMDEYSYELSMSVQKTLSNDMNINAQFHDALWDSNQQETEIKDILNKGTNLLIIGIINYASADNIAALAKEKGVKVIFFVREVYSDTLNTIPNNDNTVFVGSRNDVAGDMQGELIADYLTMDNLSNGDKNPYKVEDDTTINYVLLRGATGNQSADIRTKRVIDTANRLLQEQGNNIVLKAVKDPIDCEWDGGKAQQEMTDLLMLQAVQKPTSGDNGKINMVIGNNDDLACGAIDAMSSSQYNYNKGDLNNTILAFGMDASTKGKGYVQQNRMAATLELDVQYHSDLITKVVQNIVDGKEKDDMVADVQSVRDDKQVFVDGRIVLFDYTKYEKN